MINQTQFQKLYNFLKNEIPITESYSPEHYGASNCNGLSSVKRILYCVTPSPAIDAYFIEKDYDLLICRHIGSSTVPNLTFHTALDFCEGGLTNYWNNIIGVKNPKQIIKNAGIYGELRKEISFTELVAKLDFAVDGIIGQVESNKSIIRSVAICSGFGAIIQRNVEDLNVDCYILGQTLYDFELNSSKLNGIIELGHTKSERIGVHCLRKMLKRFNPNILVDFTPLELDVYGTEVSKRRLKPF